MELKGVVFDNKNGGEFISTLRGRVDEYFNKKGISRHANFNMVMKTLFMLALYFVPYAFIVSGMVTNAWLLLLLWTVMGFGIGGIGLSIMHDANHGSYSKNKGINRFLGAMLNVVGGHDTTWRIQHNVLHHSFTNVHGLDEDLDPGGMMRFSPHTPWKKAYKYQHIYAWFFYSLMTLSWVTIKDFKQLVRYNKMGLMKGQQTTFRKELIMAIATKVIFYGYFVFIPIFVTGISWWLVLIGLFVATSVSGLVLAAIFQPAHVMEDNEFPMPKEGTNLIENNWAIHQMVTTANFSPKSIFFSWYVGGLNYQIEHHLFPNICHVHYRKISGIVRKTAEEFNLPYHVQPTFVKALWEHTKMLKALGKKPEVQPVPA